MTGKKLKIRCRETTMPPGPNAECQKQVWNFVLQISFVQAAVSRFNPSDSDGFLLHLCPEGVLNLTPPINSPSFPFFTIKGMECISNLRLAHFVRLKLGFEEN